MPKKNPPKPKITNASKEEREKECIEHLVEVAVPKMIEDKTVSYIIVAMDAEQGISEHVFINSAPIDVICFCPVLDKIKDKLLYAIAEGFIEFSKEKSKESVKQ